MSIQLSAGGQNAEQVPSSLASVQAADEVAAAVGDNSTLSEGEVLASADNVHHAKPISDIDVSIAEATPHPHFAASLAARAPSSSPIVLFAGGPVTLQAASPFVQADGSIVADKAHHRPRSAAVLPEDRVASRKKQHLAALRQASAIKLRRAVMKAAEGAGADDNQREPAAQPAAKTTGHSPDGSAEKQQQQDARVTLAPSALLASHAVDPRQWVLAIRKPKTKLQGSKSTSLEHTTVTAQGGREATLSATSHQPPDLAAVPALEEKLTLADLKRLMYGFASESAITDAELLDRMEQEAAKKRKGTFTDAVANSRAVNANSSRGNESSPQWEKTDEQWADHLAGEGHSADGISRGTPSVIATSLPATAEELTSMLLLGPSAVTNAAVHTRKVGIHENEGNASTASAPAIPATHAISFERVLSEEAFIALMREVLAANTVLQADHAKDVDPSADNEKDSGDEHGSSVSAPPQAHTHDEEIRQLLKKVDYDGRGSVTWHELATFFISQSRHRAQLSRMSVQYSEKPTPSECSSALERHQRGITCYTRNDSKKILLTGSMDGSVHAWGLRSLAHRGLVFSCPEPGWIVGVHYGFLARSLFIVTMDRKVYILDGGTFEVLRSYQGRAVDDSNASVVYAHDTTRMVRVGGTAPPPPTTTAKLTGDGRQSAEEKKLQEQHRFLRKKAAESVDGLASLRLGHLGSIGGRDSAAPVAVMTTALAYETLDLDNAPLTTRGSGPYAERRIQENAIVGLVDAITASAFHYSALEEETLLLGTSSGDVHLVVIPSKANKKVLVPKHVLRRVHADRVNKLELLPAMDALMTCGEDGKVIMTSLVSGKALRVFYAPNFPNQHVAVRDFAVNAPLRLMVSVGPERNGLVWDFTQFHPVAVLDAHNSCCHSCAIVAPADSLASQGEHGLSNAALPPPHIMTSGADGSIHVFDVNGFHRMQTISATRHRRQEGGGGGHVDLVGAEGNSGEGGNYAGKDGMACVNQDYVPHLMVPELGRRSILCFSRYVYRLQMKRQITNSCPVRYAGHNALMLSLLYSKSFDMIVTVDMDAMAMTWGRADGKNIFAFSLSDFSDSAAMNTTRLTAVALDGMQRRMMTGFRNGAVVVWNVMNGQAINFITAGMADEQQATTSHAARGDLNSREGGAVSAARMKQDAERPWRQALREKTGGAEALPQQAADTAKGAEAGATAVAVSAGTREVTAIASLIRHNVVFFVFAIRSTVYVVQEDAATFTIASMYNSWTIPAVYGEVNSLLQVSPQIMACGTSSGALLFFHVLSGKQEGAALWVKDVSSPLLQQHAMGSAASPNTRSPHHSSGHSVNYCNNNNNNSTVMPKNFSGSIAAMPTSNALVDIVAGGGERLASMATHVGGNAPARARSVTTPPPLAAMAPPEARGRSPTNFASTTHRMRSTGLGSIGALKMVEGGASFAGSFLGAALTGNAPFANVTPVTARITKLIPMAHIHPHLLLSAHVDGTVALWHSLRRVYLGSVNLLSAASQQHDGAGAQCLRRSSDEGRGSRRSCGSGDTANNSGGEDNDDAPTVAVDVNVRNSTLVFTDTSGSIHVCEIAFRALKLDSREEQHALTLPNPAWHRLSFTPEADPAELPQLRQREHEKEEQNEVVAANDNDNDMSSQASRKPSLSSVTPTSSAPMRIETQAKKHSQSDKERVVYVLDRFAQVHVFPSGLTSLSSVLIIDPLSKTEQKPDRETDDDALTEARKQETAPVVVCCSSESQYSRVFTLGGLPVGEPGMDPWDLSDKHSYRYMGKLVFPDEENLDVGEDRPGGQEPDTEAETEGREEIEDDEDDVAEVAEASEPSADRNAEFYFDYLDDAYAAYQQQQQQAFLASIRRAAPGRSLGSRAGRAPPAGPLLGYVPHVSEGGPLAKPSPPSGAAMPTAAAPTAGEPTAGKDVPSGAPLEAEAATMTAASGDPAAQLPAMSVPLAVPLKQFYNTGVRHLAPAADSGQERSAGLGGFAPDANVISTRMTKNTKDTRMYGQVLKDDFARQIRLDRRLRKQQESGTAGTSGGGGGGDAFALGFVSMQSVSDTDKSPSFASLDAPDKKAFRPGTGVGNASTSTAVNAESDAAEKRLPSPERIFLQQIALREEEEMTSPRDNYGRDNHARPSTSLFREDTKSSSNTGALSAVQHGEQPQQLSALHCGATAPVEDGTLVDFVGIETVHSPLASTAAGTPVSSPSTGVTRRSSKRGSKGASTGVGSHAATAGALHEGSASVLLALTSTTVPRELPPLFLSASRGHSPIRHDSSRSAGGQDSCASSVARRSITDRQGKAAVVDKDRDVENHEGYDPNASPRRMARPQYRSVLIDAPASATGAKGRGLAGATGKANRRRGRAFGPKRNGSRRQSTLRLISPPILTLAERATSPSAASAAPVPLASPTILSTAALARTDSSLKIQGSLPNASLSVSGVAGKGSAAPRFAAVSIASVPAEGKAFETAVVEVDPAGQRERIEALLNAKRAEVVRNMGGTDVVTSLATADAALLTAAGGGGGTGKPERGSTTATRRNGQATANLSAGPTASATGATAARSFITSVCSRMYIAPVEELEPPAGSRSHEDVKAWRDHLKRLQEGRPTTASRAKTQLAKH